MFWVWEKYLQLQRCAIWRISNIKVWIDNKISTVRFGKRLPIYTDGLITYFHSHIEKFKVIWFYFSYKKSFQPTCPITIALKYWTRFRPISYSALELDSIRPISFSALTFKKLCLHSNKMKNTDEKCQDHAAEILYLSIREKTLLFLWNWNQEYHQFPIGVVFPFSFFKSKSILD